MQRSMQVVIYRLWRSVDYLHLILIEFTDTPVSCYSRRLVNYILSTHVLQWRICQCIVTWWFGSRWTRAWLTSHCPSVLWHCWLGHISLTRKIVSEYDLYCVEWDVKPYYTCQCIRVKPFSNLSKLLTISCSRKNSVMIFKWFKSYRIDQHTPTNMHYWKQYHLCNAIAAWVIISKPKLVSALVRLC